MQQQQFQRRMPERGITVHEDIHNKGTDNFRHN